jgi:hypothetical protein
VVVVVTLEVEAGVLELAELVELVVLGGSCDVPELLVPVVETGGPACVGIPTYQPMVYGYSRVAS